MEEIAQSFNAAKNLRAMFPNLDIVKFFMAFLVVEIHERPFGTPPLVQGVDCIAAPSSSSRRRSCAFAAWMSRNFQTERRTCVRVRKTIKKLLLLYAAWTLIYIPVSLFGYVFNGFGPTGALVFFCSGHPVRRREHLFMAALVPSRKLCRILTCIHHASERNAPRPHSWGSGGFHAIRLCNVVCLRMVGYTCFLSRALDLYFKVFINVRNGLFEGFFYVAVGMCLGMKWERAVTVAPIASSALVVFGVLGCVFVSPDAHLPFCASYGLGVFLLSIHRYGEEAD